MTITISAHNGPLPDPLTLARYDQVVPGLAATIVEEFQAQSAHRRHLERMAVENANRRANHGLYIGGLLLLVLLVIGGLAILHNYQPAGLAAIVIAVVSGIGGLYRARSERHKELHEKEMNVPRILPGEPSRNR